MNLNFRGFEVKEEYNEEYEETLYWIEVNGNIIDLDLNHSTDEFSIHFSHSVIICKKCDSFCDYEYENCPCQQYEPSSIASRAKRKDGSTIYHCQNGESKWLNNEEAQAQRPDYCQKIKNMLGEIGL